MTKNICISGYYGFDNFGDETILKILVENIKKYSSDCSITVFSSNPNKTSEELGVNSVYSFDLKGIFKSISKCNCVISGGGSLLQDVTSKKSLLYYMFILFLAQLFGKKTMIFSQGIGPIRNSLLFKFAICILKKAKYVTVRDYKSFDLLKNNGVAAILCNDPVWNLKLNDVQKTEKVGIQLREYSCLTSSKIDKIAQLVNKYYSQKEINIFSFQNTFDMKICKEFEQKLLAINPSINVKVIENTSNNKIIEDILSLDILIAMRFHACLVGLKAGVKVLPLSYDIKVETLAKEFEIEYIDLFSSNSIEDIFDKFVNQEIKDNSAKINAKVFDFKSMIEQL